MFLYSRRSYGSHLSNELFPIPQPSSRFVAREIKQKLRLIFYGHPVKIPENSYKIERNYSVYHLLGLIYFLFPHLALQMHPLLLILIRAGASADTSGDEFANKYSKKSQY